MPTIIYYTARIAEEVKDSAFDEEQGSQNGQESQEGDSANNEEQEGNQ